MGSFVQFAINASSVITVIADVGVILLFAVLLTPLQERGWGKKIARLLGRHAIRTAFAIGLVSVAGSLFFSNVAGFEPCELCWIQRGLLYTLTVILAVGLIARRAERRRAFDKFMRMCGLVLSGIGVPVAVYNVWLQLGGGALIPCSATGPSCSYVYFIRFGYVTIPTMSLTAFLIILALMLLGEGYVEA
jgi:disulfide bond formation protein DsbB